MIYIHDRNFKQIQILEGYESLIWVSKYYDLGEFELVIEVGQEDYSALKEDNLIRKNKDNVFGVIKSIKVENENGIEKLTVKGKLIDVYMDQRLIWGTYNFANKSVEEVVGSLFISQVSSPTDLKRKIPKYEWIGYKGFTEYINYQVSYMNLLSTVISICKTNEIGFRSTYNDKDDKLYLECYKGLDRSTNQSENDVCIFSVDLDNVFSQEYLIDSGDYKNICLVAGEGEGSARKLVTVGDDSLEGLDRYELFVDARDLQKDINTDSQYLKILTERGNSKLSEQNKIESFDMELNLNSTYIYKQDFNLGDIVTTVNKKYNIISHKRIVETEEVYEEGTMMLYVVLGDGMPTILNKLKRGDFNGGKR